MPFDSYSHLVSHGWSGRGNGLRQGAISKPIIPRHRKGQGGVGVDRDDASPFWDHIYAAAAQSIRINVPNDSDDSDDGHVDEAAELTKSDPSTVPNLWKRSQKAASVVANANSCENTGSLSINSLFSDSKRTAARKLLYEKFSRGPTLAPVATLQGDSVYNDHKTPPVHGEFAKTNRCDLGMTLEENSISRRQLNTEHPTENVEEQSKTRKKGQKRKKL